MDRLILRNTGTEYEYVNDIGIGVAPGEELDLIPNYRDEDLLESVDLQGALQGNLEVWFNDTIYMTYNDVIDYLTKLTKYDVIDYNYISSEDSATDVTSEELEQLTNGSNVSLHRHDNRYFTQTQLSMPGQASVHWDNITNKPQGDSLIEQGGQLYIFDPIRNKTLSVHEQNFVFSSKAANGRFLDYGKSFGFDVGAVSPYNATITRLTISASRNYNGKDVEVRKNNTVVLTTSTMSNNIENVDLDLDIDGGDLLQVFVGVGGPALKDVVATLFVRERI